MKNILLIGVGRFGRHIAMHLNQLGHQVMAVDRNEERIDAVMPYVPFCRDRESYTSRP